MSKLHPADYMTLAMARLLRDKEIVFHGVASPMPMVATLIARKMHAPDLVYLSIAGGVDAYPERLPCETTTDYCLLEKAVAFFPLMEIFDLSARGKLDTAFLGGVQIDMYGRTNLSVIGEFSRPKVRLPGGAGSAVVMPTAKKTILWRTKHDTSSFVAKLPFVTASGNSEYAISPLCIFKKSEGKLKLWRWFEDATLQQIKENTGFLVELTEDAQKFETPSDIELSLLKEIDPHGVRYREFT